MTELFDISKFINKGDRIAWSGGAMEPTALLGLLEKRLDDVPDDVSALLNISLTDCIDARRLAAKIRLVALGGAVTNQRFQAFGALDVLPTNYAMLPRLVADGSLAIDCALVQLAADGAGYNAALMMDHLTAALPTARVVVAEVNDQLPVTYGDSHVDAADVDHIIQVSRPPITVASRPSQALEQQIGAHVARLIEDGTTIEIGLGSLPDAVLEALHSKRDLGIHSGAIGDRVADLVDAGVITNRRKPFDQGKCIVGALLGTQDFYRWAHRNDAIEMRSPRYTHDIAVLGEIPGFTGINSALEIDLTGQINAETLGDRHVGMIGGQSDFMRGCMQAPGGRSIIVMQAAARNNSISRIVGRLGAGVVTTARSDADIVVTEYGIAELRGRSVSERARNLIKIAHPDFRPALTKAASESLM